MTQHTASNNNSNNTSTTRRRVGLAAFAALGLPLGAMLAPSTAAAAPGDSLDAPDLDAPDLDAPDLEAPDHDAPDHDALLSFDDFAILLPNPVPPIPIPFPVDRPIPDNVPGPDDGPGLPIELPELDDPLNLFPFDPSDFTLPTGPGDDDDDEEEPECNEYSAANFTADAEHHEGDLIELQLTYSDMDVCDYTVWTAVAEPGAVGVLGQTTVGMVNIAFATDSAGYYQQTWMHHDLCELEIRVAVEESLAFTAPHTDLGCEDEIPGVHDDEPGDDGDEPSDDGAEPEDDGDEPGDDGDEPEDDGDEPEDDGADTPEEARPLSEPETPDTPSGGLPQTGTNMTTIMFAIGLMTLGAGSVIALATRRREELPIV